MKREIVPPEEVEMALEERERWAILLFWTSMPSSLTC
jgi:hypothetical protein